MLLSLLLSPLYATESTEINQILNKLPATEQQQIRNLLKHPDQDLALSHMSDKEKETTAGVTADFKNKAIEKHVDIANSLPPPKQLELGSSPAGSEKSIENPDIAVKKPLQVASESVRRVKEELQSIKKSSMDGGILQKSASFLESDKLLSSIKKPPVEIPKLQQLGIKQEAVIKPADIKGAEVKPI